MPSLHVAFCFSLSFPLLPSTPCHYIVHLSTCHPPIFLPLHSFLLPIAFSICLPSSLTSIPINFCVGCFVCYHCHPSITPPAPLLSQRKEQCFSKLMVHFHLSPWWLSKMKLQISYEGETLHTTLLASQKNHYRQINKQESLFFVIIIILSGNKESVVPWMSNGLSMTKFPFHTTERSTGRSLMSLPS